MNNQQWQEGKTYQFKPDRIDEFKRLNSSNKKIAILIRNNKFTVESVDGAGAIIDLVEFSKYDIDIEYWFDKSEIEYFNLVDDTTEELPMTNTNNIRPNVDIVVEWLNKLQYVVDNDTTTVGYGLMPDSDGIIMLSTDFGDITGASSVHNFITNRYDLLQQEAKHKKNNELMERKAKLEAELADVVALLEEVK